MLCNTNTIRVSPICDSHHSDTCWQLFEILEFQIAISHSRSHRNLFEIANCWSSFSTVKSSCLPLCVLCAAVGKKKRLQSMYVSSASSDLLRDETKTGVDKSPGTVARNIDIKMKVINLDICMQNLSWLQLVGKVHTILPSLSVRPFVCHALEISTRGPEFDAQTWTNHFLWFQGQYWLIPVEN